MRYSPLLNIVLCSGVRVQGLMPDRLPIPSSKVNLDTLLLVIIITWTFRLRNRHNSHDLESAQSMSMHDGYERCCASRAAASTCNIVYISEYAGCPTPVRTKLCVRFLQKSSQTRRTSSLNRCSRSGQADVMLLPLSSFIHDTLLLHPYQRGQVPHILIELFAL